MNDTSIVDRVLQQICVDDITVLSEAEMEKYIPQSVSRSADAVLHYGREASIVPLVVCYDAMLKYSYDKLRNFCIEIKSNRGVLVCINKRKKGFSYAYITFNVDDTNRYSE